MRTFLQSATLTLALLILPGCDNGDAAKFNDNVVNSLDQIGDATEAFGKAIAPATEGKPANIEEVRRAHKKCLDTVARVKAEAQSWKVPEKASAQKVLDCHNNYLVILEDAIKDFAEVVNILEDKGLRKDQKSKKIVALSREQVQRETSAFGDLQDAQRVFAREYNLKLVPPRKK